MIVPAYLPYYVLTGTIGMIAALLFGLRSALRNAGWTTYDRTVTVGAAAITVIGWFLLAIARIGRCLSYRHGSYPHDPIRNSRFDPHRRVTDLAIAPRRANH